jgi:hypothetical protein
MGSAEGAWVVPSIAAPILFAPVPPPGRPAYDRASLGRALREGRDPAGRTLAPLMPRYRLSDGEVAALGAYLETLSVGPSPGVDGETIRFATVVTEDLAPEEREAVLAVLRTYAAEKNRQTRLERRRRPHGTAPGTRQPTTFREWALDVWTLTGPEDGWRAQLEERYRAQPVFALVGGATAGTWGPIGRFCESHEIPCLLPSTPLPDSEPGDFYTLHFSNGVELEADLIASHLEAAKTRTVAQLHCGIAGRRGAAALGRTLRQRGVTVVDVPMDCQAPPPAEALSLPAGGSDGATVLWLGRGPLARLGQRLPGGRVYFSSTLVGPVADEPLPTTRGPAFMAHPFRLPGELDPALARFLAWARARRIDVRFPRLQAEAFFAALAANDAVSHLRRFYVRDYVLDMIDHAQNLAAYVPLRPRPGLGPSQRFLAKGGYVVPVRDGRPVSQGATWIQP